LEQDEGKAELSFDFEEEHCPWFVT
jgi:hypothetical protein